MKRISTLLCTICLTVCMLTPKQYADAAYTDVVSGGDYTYAAHEMTVSDGNEATEKEAYAALQELLAERDIMALLYLSDEITLHQEASEESDSVVTVSSGHSVLIQNVVLDEYGMSWVKVSLYRAGEQYEGYVPRENIACSDERFLKWEIQYDRNPEGLSLYGAGERGVSGAKKKEIALFPESYRSALTALAEEHPNWTFVVQKTNLDWDTVIDNELLGGRSLVHSSFPDYTKDGAYDDFGWFYATRGILEYYMDPRNGLTEDGIFQFEQLTYNEEHHTQAAVAAFLKGTFMESDGTKKTYAPGTVMNYDLIFWAIGAEEGREVSPFHLAARVLQEQGVKGGSALISGNYTGANGIYKGYYNYFNVGATGSTQKEVVENGLKYAKNATLNGKAYPWNNAYASILGGAEVISANYIKKGQDTLYLQKYNVGPDSYYAHYTHQYMQNISAPASEAKSIKKLYESADSLESAFVFKIPVYDNMPATACGMPTDSKSIALEIPSGYDSTTVYLDGVAYTAKAQNGKYTVEAKDKKAQTAVVFKYDKKGIPTGMYVWTLEYKDDKYTATAQPKLKNLLSYHGFSIRLTGKTGIRFKTGISKSLRTTLTGKGVNGYKLKEYGTLVMTETNRKKYGMVKGGKKVLGGMAYGTNSKGKLVDNVFETVKGRIRYTSVLTGIPVKEYKEEYAFGGYAVLEKDGKSITIYGPVVSRSMYSLAEQLLELGTYKEGTAADKFLRNLIKKADAAGK